MGAFREKPPQETSVEDSLKYLQRQSDKFGSLSVCAEMLLIPDFCEWPGSIERHHNYPGGLVVHTAEVLQYALGLAEAHRGVDIRVLVAATIFHDFAKTRDYERIPGTPLFREAPYRRSIRHVSGSHAHWYHVTQGALPLDFVDAVSHCILAHHGRQEWGSPIEPQTVEASVLHYADMLSAQYGRGK